MTSFEQAIARGKIEYAEKYGFLKLSDLDQIQRMLGYKIEYLDNKTRARIHTPTKLLDVSVKMENKF